MIASFDFSGTIDTHRWLRDLAGILHTNGVEVVMLTALDAKQWDRELAKRIDWLRTHNIDWMQVVPVRGGREALAKANVCRDKGISMHFDNNRRVIKHLANTSTTGVLV